MTEKMMLRFFIIILIAFLGYSSKSAPKYSSVQAAVLSASNISVQQASTVESLVIERLPDVIHRLSTISPDHVFYLLYDDTFKGADGLLKAYTRITRGVTILKLMSDMDVLIDSLSSPLTDVSIGRRNFLVICSSSNIIRLFQMISSKNLEDPMLWWILIVTEEYANNFLHGVLREGSQVIVVHMKDAESLKLFSSFVEQDGGVGFREATTTLSPEAPLSFLKSDVFEDLEESYSDFEGRQLSVAANDNNPFIVLKEEDGELSAVAGFEYAIVDSLSKALNFTYRMVTPEDGKWGGPLPDGTVVGMIGEVAYRRAHFALCEITITRVREEVIDFSYPYYIESLTLISRTPREKTRTFAAFSPFTPFVWLCIAAILLLLGPVLTFESWLIKKYSPGEYVADSIQDFMLNLFGSLVKQENLIHSQYWPHKLTFFFWYLFSLNVSVLYSGMLTATLIIPSFEKPINALTDLPMAVENGFTLVVTDDTSDMYMFKDAKEGIYAETWKLFDQDDWTKSFIPHPSYAMEGILDDKLVLINGILGARYLSMRRGIRRYHFARDSFASQYYGVACMSGAPFKHAFNKMFSYMVEGGLITKWVDNEFEKVTGDNTVIEKSGPRAFTVNQLQAAFYVLPIGYVIGSLFLGLEIISKYC